MRGTVMRCTLLYWNQRAMLRELLLLFLITSTVGGKTYSQEISFAQRSSIIKLVVKLDTSAKDKAIYIGGRPKIKIGLLDANNKSLTAIKDFKITVYVKSESGETIETKEVIIKEGT